MAGNAPVDELLPYLARLLGAPVTADQPLPLRSVHRSALAAWSRRQGIAVRFNAITSTAPVTARQLLQADAADTAPPPLNVAPTAVLPPATGAQVLGLGIDIESVDSLPVADDYRAHPFYQDNFTPAELSHCIRQADPRASLCGTWAAKEAVLKAGAAAPIGRLVAVEIAHDAAGRPTRPGCQLSVSHTATAAVAVCIALGSSAVPAVAVTVPARPPPPPPAPAAAPSPAFAWKVAAAIAGALAVGSLTLAAYAWT